MTLARHIIAAVGVLGLLAGCATQRGPLVSGDAQAGCASLADMIQMECSVGATRAIRIDHGTVSGRIYFSSGQVIHAELGKLTGEAALFEMLGWPGGHIVVADGVQPAIQTIARHWQRLLIEAGATAAH